MFLRNFAQVWGVTIGGTVLQNELQNRLPADLLNLVPDGTELAYAAIPLINGLPEPVRSEVRRAFAESIKVVWYVMAGIAGIGLLASLAMKGLPLHTSVNEEWVLNKERNSNESAA
jgi:hypothetical protein